MSIVIAIEGSSGIEWETRQSSTLHFASRRRHLHALRGIDDQGVLPGPPRRYWSNRHHGCALHQLWRGHRPGHSSEQIEPDAGSLARREAAKVCSTGRSRYVRGARSERPWERQAARRLATCRSPCGRPGREMRPCRLLLPAERGSSVGPYVPLSVRRAIGSPSSREGLKRNGPVAQPSRSSSGMAENAGAWEHCLEGADAVINLAGAPIADGALDRYP